MGVNFCYGAVKILDSLNIVDYISFGSEFGDLSVLDKFADIFYYQQSEYVSLLNHELAKGLAFPKARENAVLMYLNDIRKYSNILSNPNNILAIEYLKALKRTKSFIKPITIKRENVGYNDLGVSNSFASATSIRDMIINNSLTRLPYVKPSQTYKDLSKFEKEIIYTLRKMSLAEIANLPDVCEGLEHAIKNAANSCNTLAEFMNIIQTKRYTSTRIQRILLYALLGITKSDMKMSYKTSPYIRVLGFNQKGRDLLSVISHSKKNTEVITSVLSIDITATNIYTLGYVEDSWSNLDFTNNMIIL